MPDHQSQAQAHCPAGPLPQQEHQKHPPLGPGHKVGTGMQPQFSGCFTGQGHLLALETLALHRAIRSLGTSLTTDVTLYWLAFIPNLNMEPANSQEPRNVLRYDHRENLSSSNMSCRPSHL